MITLRAEEMQENRYSRLRLIPWWDHSKISGCRVLVVGAGALGTEILKNLVLLGFRQIVIVDLDVIEESNLSRAILYRTADIGKSKAPRRRIRMPRHRRPMRCGAAGGEYSARLRIGTV